jgi:CRP-like cAMP-binding protein
LFYVADYAAQKEIAVIDSKIFQKYSLFGGLLTEQIESIIPLMVQEKYTAGEIIIAEGTPNDRIHFILEGKASAIKGGMVIYDFDEGSTFGEMEVLDVMPAAATIKAITDVTILSISNMGFRKIYKNDIKSFTLMLMNLARDLSRRLRIANDKITNGK